MKIRDLFKKWWFWLIVAIYGLFNLSTQMAINGLDASLGAFLGAMVGGFIMIFIISAVVLTIIRLVKHFTGKKKGLNY